MGNYPSPMTRRLAITIALYIERFGAWPDEVRLSSDALYWIAKGLDQEHFTALADRLKLRVTRHTLFAVGGSAGHQVYTQKVHPHQETVERVERELGHDIESRIHDEPASIHREIIDEFGGERCFHRLLIGELIRWGDLGPALGIWHLAALPVVTRLPIGGLFDLRLDRPTGPPDYLDIWLRRPTRGRYEQQVAAATGCNRIYLLVVGARPDWPGADDATWILREEFLTAIASRASGLGGDALGDLTRAYSERLSAEV